ncbi:MAG: hypothetical protein IJE91_00965 [Clostridia bacterium]|nr:hypothetical protein [Clostridia bacterium]
MAKLWNSLSLFISKLLDVTDIWGTNDEFEAKREEMMDNFNNFSTHSGGGGADGGFSVWIPIAIFSVIFVVVTVIIIVSVVKAKRKTSELATKVKDKIKENIEHEKTKDICPYCGTRLKEEENRCPGCGAQRK